MECVAIEMGGNIWTNNNLKFPQTTCLTEIKNTLEGKVHTMLKKYKDERNREKKGKMKE